MRDVLPELMQWWESGETIGVGTVVATFRSAPRPPGASMLVGPEGTAVGSVSGGCVESDVYALAEEVLVTGSPVLRRYGISDSDALAVGLTCGGILDVFVEVVSSTTFPGLGAVAADVAALRGEEAVAAAPIAFGRVRIDTAAREVTRDGGVVPLTPKGYDLLLALVRREGAVVSRVDLLREVWGMAPDVMTRTVDSHMAELRKRLEDDPAEPRHLRTVWKVGYRFVR